MLTTSDKSNKFKHTQNLGQQPKVSRTAAGWFPNRVGLHVHTCSKIHLKKLFLPCATNPDADTDPRQLFSVPGTNFWRHTCIQPWYVVFLIMGWKSFYSCHPDQYWLPWRLFLIDRTKVCSQIWVWHIDRSSKGRKFSLWAVLPRFMLQWASKTIRGIIK